MITMNALFLRIALLMALQMGANGALADNGTLTNKIKENESTVIYAGEQVEIFSKVLDEQRSLLIKLPRDYHIDENKHYPVLYTLDGETHFAHVSGTVDWLSLQAFRIPEMIVVAVVNTNRGRDMSATYNGGGANDFLAFLDKELLPFIDKNYRTQPFRLLAAHSMAGHFALNAYRQNAQLFNAYITMSPFFRQDRKEIQLTDLLAEQLNKQQQQHRFIYASIGDEERLMSQYEKFVKALENSKDTSLRWHSLVSLSDSHMSIPSNTINNALQFVFEPQQLAPTSVIAGQGVDAIKAYYEKLSSDVYGYEVTAEISIDRLGLHLMRNESTPEEAIEVLETNARWYPDSANVYASLARAYSRAKQYEKALLLMNKTLELLPAQSPDRGFYQRLKQRIANAKENAMNKAAG